MKAWLHKIELIVDKIIPYLVFILLLIVIGELLFSEQIQKYVLWINVAYYFIVGIFVIDLIFKYIRIRNIPKFLRKCWIDIIAVFPFFLLFRLVEETGILLRFGERIAETQAVFHEAVEIEKETGKIIGE